MGWSPRVSSVAGRFVRFVHVLSTRQAFFDATFRQLFIAVSPAAPFPCWMAEIRGTLTRVISGSCIQWHECSVVD